MLAGLRIVVAQLQRIVLGAGSGALAGLGGWVFLTGLDHITQFRIDHGVIVWFLPLAGLGLGLVYHYGAGPARAGNALLLDQIHEPTTWVPKRMAPLIVVATWTTHLFGGSAGREGTALQMSGSLTDSMARLLRLPIAERRLMLQVALASGFGAVFGVPVAGTVFALEVPRLGRMRFEALVPALTGAVVGDRVVRALGYRHARLLPLGVRIDTATLLRVVVLGVACGLTAAAFARLAHAIAHGVARIGWPPLRPMVGGFALVALVVLVGRDYLGLSTPLALHALAGAHTDAWVFALKLLFTAITLGTGFPGGEVTPLFVMGATLGSTLSGPLGLDPRVGAAAGFVAVFAGAANTPIACTVMAMELFGGAGAALFAVTCALSYLCSGHAGIYATQRVPVDKYGRDVGSAPTLRELHRRDRP